MALLDDKRQFSADMVPWKIVLMLKVNTRDNLYVKEDNNEYRRPLYLVFYSSHPPPTPTPTYSDIHKDPCLAISLVAGWHMSLLLSSHSPD